LTSHLNSNFKSVRQMQQLLIRAEKYGKELDFDEVTIAGLKVTAHFIAYSYAYSCGYKLGLQLAISQEEVMAQRQAFEILGLGQYANESEAHRRFRELALQHHPDNCRTNCEEEGKKMVQINNAYELLKKKFA